MFIDHIGSPLSIRNTNSHSRYISQTGSTSQTDSTSKIKICRLTRRFALPNGFALKFLRIIDCLSGGL